MISVSLGRLRALFCSLNRYCALLSVHIKVKIPIQLIYVPFHTTVLLSPPNLAVEASSREYRPALSIPIGRPI